MEIMGVVYVRTSPLNHAPVGASSTSPEGRGGLNNGNVKTRLIASLQETIKGDNLTWTTNQDLTPCIPLL